MDKDYIYESLDAKDLKRENNGNFAACESLWQPCSADGVKQIVSRIQDFCEFDADFLAKNKNYDGIPYSTEDYKWENVVKRLDAGKVVVDIRGEEKKNLSVRDLLEKFKIDNDRMLLSE